MTREVQVYGLFLKSFNRIKYVGITQNSLHTRRLEHIRGKKLDANDVEIRLLAVCATKEEAAKVEAELIKQHDTIHNGFNVSPYITSGNANAKSEEERARISAALKGKAKPESEVLARVGKKKKDNGLPANVRRQGKNYQVVLGGAIRNGVKSNHFFGVYKSLDDASSVALAVAAYAKQNNMVVDNFSHPLWVKVQKPKNGLPKGVSKVKYDLYQVSFRANFGGKNMTVGFGSFSDVNDAIEVAAAAQEYINKNGRADGFRHPKVKVAKFID